MTSHYERLGRAFREACEQQEVLGSVDGGPDRLELRFEAQEGAGPELIEQAFRDELRKAGVEFAAIESPEQLAESEVAAAAQALRTAVARLRVLMIEYNSYISGGLGWPFAGSPEPLRARGIANYRYPARGNVDVVSHRDHASITVHGGDLGATTSSGFYVPTRVRGDFEATLRYQLGDWQPGEQSVCVALFAQDEPSQLRYYSQRRTARGRAHEVLANFNNQVLSEPVPVTQTEGWWRVARRGDVVTISHREGDDWLALGEHRGDPPNDVLFGAKIWSSGQAGPFEARLFDLTVEGEFPEDQLLPVPVRPDPRFAD